MGIRRTLKRFTLSIVAAGIASAALATGAQASHFANLGSISVPGGSVAGPYPSPIAVSGLTGKVSKVTPTISGLEGEFDDAQMLLVGPGGQTTVLWRSVCQDALNFNGVSYLFDDSGSALPATGCPGSGIHRPTDLDLSPVPFTSPAPQGQPYGANLAVFNATDPNGTWNLFVESTQAGGAGTINAGWSLDVDTLPNVVTTPKKKCKKKKHRSAESAKKKKCEKKKKKKKK